MTSSTRDCDDHHRVNSLIYRCLPHSGGLADQPAGWPAPTFHLIPTVLLMIHFSRRPFPQMTICRYDRLTTSGSNRPRLRFMLGASKNRSVFVRSVCILAIALVCAIGVVQAVHSHPDDSAASHHSCSICSIAHAGLNIETVSAAPVLISAALATAAPEQPSVFRAAVVHFIRPPPSF